MVIEMESGDGPEIVLLKENIEFLSLIGAEIGFDLKGGCGQILGLTYKNKEK